MCAEHFDTAEEDSMIGRRRDFLVLVLAAAVVCWSGVGTAQNATSAASGDVAQVTLDVQGMH